MKMKYFADSERKIILVSDVIYPLGTYMQEERLKVNIGCQIMLAPTKVIKVSYRLISHVDLFDLDSDAAGK